MDFSEIIKNRYSLRHLSNEKVGDEQIKSILEAARLAPTAVDKQPFKIWVLKSEEAHLKAADAFSFDFAKKAPVIFIGSTDIGIL